MHNFEKSPPLKHTGQTSVRTWGTEHIIGRGWGVETG